MKFITIVNPVSGGKKSIQIFNKVESIFNSHNIKLYKYETEFQGHAEKLITDIDINIYDGIIIIGGDGTFHEIANGLLNRSDKKTIPIGIIPGGSGNSFMMDLNLSEPIKATNKIINLKTRPIDVAKIHTGKKYIYSINLIGWGMVTDVGIRSERYRLIGPARYTIASIIEIIFKKTRKALLEINGEKIEKEFTFIVACNSINIGKGMKMAPKAKIDDGLIDIITVEGNIKRKRLFNVLPKLFTGDHIYEPEVNYYQTNKFSIKSDTKDQLNIDGEILGSTPIHVEIIHKAIQIFN
tara:strand:+ start:14094 stop:14981 length:888 start_codon:yes stop_codon:yes gene_type:complete